MKHEAILSLRPNITTLVLEDDVVTEYASSDGLPLPNDEEIAAEVARLKGLEDSTKYQRDRKDEYPALQDQLDMLYWDRVNGTTNWQDTIAAVKAKYPKPE